jgi:DNA polymerase III alpha subunit
VSRRGLLAIADVALERHKQKLKGKAAVFTTAPSWLQAPELPDTMRDVLIGEREHLGMYVTSHPIQHLNLKAPHSALFVNDRGADERYVTKADTWVELAGVLVEVETKTTRRGSLMGFFGLEMLDGVVRCLCFGETAEGLENGWVVRAKGVIEDRAYRASLDGGGRGWSEAPVHTRESDRVVKVTKLQFVERW